MRSNFDDSDDDLEINDLEYPKLSKEQYKGIYNQARYNYRHKISKAIPQKVDEVKIPKQTPKDDIDRIALNDPDLVSFDFFGMFTSERFDRLMLALKTNTNLQSLNFENIPLHQSHFVKIAEVLKVNHTLKKPEFSGYST